MHDAWATCETQDLSDAHMCFAAVTPSVPCGGASLPEQPCCLQSCHATCITEAECCVVQGALPPAHGKRLQLQELALKPEMCSPAGTAAAAALRPTATAAGQQHWAVKKEQSAAAASAAALSAAAPAAGQQPTAVKQGWPPAADAQSSPAGRQLRPWRQEQRPAADAAGKQPRALNERQMLPAVRQQMPVDKQKGCETSVDGVRRHLCVHLRQGDFWHRTWEESLAGRQVSTVLQGAKVGFLAPPLGMASQADTSAQCSRAGWGRGPGIPKC